MKSAPMTALLGLLLLLAPCAAFAADAKTAQSKSRTITQVVDLLQSMLDASKKDGDSERGRFAKHKCYCDSNTVEKTAEISTQTEQIEIFESKIEELQSSTGTLSEEVAKLKADIEANEASQTAALNLRTSRNGAFVALRTDLLQAIDQMNQAISTLAAIGADQTSGQAAADHKFMMAGHDSLLSKKLRTSVKQALLAASAFVTDSTHMKQTQVLESFLQAPFTGTYTAQSGEVVGILKDMRDTFKANLAAATTTEGKEVDAYTKFMASTGSALTTMKASVENKQGLLSGNDGELSTMKAQLDTAVDAKEDAETFLADLTDMCAKKADEYKQRTMLRTNEDAAIAEAISILNSDAAFATFGTVDSTSTGATKAVSLIQRASIREHRQPAPQEVQRKAAQKFLASRKPTARIAQVQAMLQAENPFKTVLDEIKKMIALIAREETQDVEQEKWCESEQTKHNGVVTSKQGEIDTLKGTISELVFKVDDELTGLKVQLVATETALEENHEAQVSETKSRTTDNQAYQKDISNLQEAHALLSKAITVLKGYYSTIMKEAGKESLVQKSAQEPPETWDSGTDQSGSAFAGQSGKGGDAISMLEFILSETEKEENLLHSQEQGGQHQFEDSMLLLTKDEQDGLAEIANLKRQLTQAEEDLMIANKDLKASQEVHDASVAYLGKIERGCTWIQANLENRKSSRVAEEKALEDAAVLIQGTPAYTAAVQAQKEEDLGDCKETCLASEAHVECQACLAKTSIPGFCAGHKGTLGC